MKPKTLCAGMLAGALGLIGGQAAAVEPDAQFHLFPARGADIVAGILDGTFDFGEAVLFGTGGLYGDEGLFEDYLRDFLLGPTGREGILAEHGFGGAMIGGYGVAANALAPHGYLVSTLLWGVGGDPNEVTSHHKPGPLMPSGGPLEGLLGPDGLVRSLGSGDFGGFGSLGGGGMASMSSLPTNLAGVVPGM
jgi:hypothetical protein